MNRFVIVKSAEENYNKISEALSMIFGNRFNIIVKDGLLIIFYNDEAYFSNVFKSLEIDLNCLISIYESSYDDYKELEIVSNLFKQAKYGDYSFKSLLISLDTIENSKDVLEFITEGSGVTEGLIEAMASCNLNVTQASKLMYMHRNTLLYKIERLIELKDFDLKSFKDLYILYKLIN